MGSNTYNIMQQLVDSGLLVGWAHANELTIHAN